MEHAIFTVKVFDGNAGEFILSIKKATADGEMSVLGRFDLTPGALHAELERLVANGWLDGAQLGTVYERLVYAALTKREHLFTLLESVATRWSGAERAAAERAWQHIHAEH